MASHSSVLAWKTAWTEEPGRLQPMGFYRVRHDLATKHAFLYFPIFLSWMQHTLYYLLYLLWFSQFSRSVMSDSLQPHESQHSRLPCPSPTPGLHSDSRPSSQ